MLQRIFNRNNLIKTNYIHLHKSNTEMLCPFLFFFFTLAYLKCLGKNHKCRVVPICWLAGSSQAVQLCTLTFYFLWEGKGPRWSPSHWFSGCLVFSCLGISQVKKRPVALEPVGVCAGGERQQNPALFLSIFSFPTILLQETAGIWDHQLHVAAVHEFLLAPAWHIGKSHLLHVLSIPEFPPANSPFLFWQLSHCSSQSSSNPSLPRPGAKEGLSSSWRWQETEHSDLTLPYSSDLHTAFS